MYYETKLDFFRKILDNYRINNCIISADDTTYRLADRGLRDSLGLPDDYNQLFCTRHETLKEKTILKLTDSFSCNYIFILLPETDCQKTFIAGPYINFEITQKTIIESATRYNVPQSLRNQIEK